MSIYNEANIYDVCINDTFLMNYYGILVCFLVTQVKTDTVYITELLTKQVEVDGVVYDMVVEDKYPAWPYIVKSRNTFTRTRFEVEPVLIKDEPYLPIKVDMNSRLHNEAKKYVECPTWGIVYAERVNNPYNKLYRRKDYDA